MPRTARKNETRDTGDGPRARRVWRIARFDERFGMEAYERKGGLDYVRMFVSASTNRQSNESTQFLAQLEELDHYYPEQRDAYEGRFWRLCRLTATQEDWLRGYLLGPSREPIGDAKLAARLHLDVRAMRATLAALKKVGLLEYVPCPDFSHPPERPEQEPTQPQDSAPTEKAVKPRTRRKGRKTGPAASLPNDSGKVRKSSEVLFELANGKPNLQSNGQMANGNPKGVAQGQTARTPTTAPPGEANADARQRIREGRPGPIPPQEVTMPEGRHPQPQAEGQPAITPPARVLPGPRIVPLHAEGDGVRMGSLLPRVVTGSAAGYAVRADEFADEIFALLRAPFDRDSREGQRERRNYRAGLLDAIDAGLGPGQIEELMAKARRDATEIAKHRKRHYANGGSPEQYWRFLFNKHLAARCGPPARAGPEAASG